MATCVISQPRLFPGLHYLHRMMVADIFVILDTVQFTPRHEENRTKVKSPQGPQWISVPIQGSGRRPRLYDTRIDDSQPWRSKAVKTFGRFYGKAPFFKDYKSEIASILESKQEMLINLDRISWEPALGPLKINCHFVYASELPVSGQGPSLLLDICKYVDADVYVSGAYGRQYLDTNMFEAEDVTVRFHEYTYPVYSQLFGGFVPFLSFLDMLVNTGLDRDKVMAGGRLVP